MIGLLAFISFADPIQVDSPRLGAGLDGAKESRNAFAIIMAPLGVDDKKPSSAMMFHPLIISALCF
jgi:hypothetical protein